MPSPGVVSVNPVTQDLTVGTNPLSIVTVEIGGVASTTTSVFQTADTNLDLQTVSVPTVGENVDLRIGSLSSPDTLLNPLLKLSRTLELTGAAVLSDGSSNATPLLSFVSATAANQVQAVGGSFGAENRGTAGSSRTSPDAVGIKAVGNIINVGVGQATGLLAAATVVSTAATLSAIEVDANNNSSVDNNATSAQSVSTGVSLYSFGSKRVAAAIEVVGPLSGTGTQFTSGLHFSGQTSGGYVGGISSAAIQDDSTSATSLLINGTHSNAAIAIAAGAGSLVIGESSPSSTTTLLEVRGQNTNGNPLILVGNSSYLQPYSLQLRNSVGIHYFGISDGVQLFVTGAIAGDAVIKASTTGTYVHVGGSVSTIKVGANNTLGFFNVTSVGQQNSTGNNTGFTASTGLSVLNGSTFTGGVGTTAFTIGDIIAALKNYGLLSQ